jgi:putative cardiolipin synthase
LTIPAAAFPSTRPQPLKQHGPLDMIAEPTTAGEPYAGMVSGRPPVVWANARVVSDSPEKRQVVSGARAGRLMNPAVLRTAQGAQTEFLMITPYFIPTAADMALLRELRGRDVRIAILTNSLEGAPGAFAESGYLRFQMPLVKAGVDLYEARSLLGSARGSGQTTSISRHGHYALHAKLYVFDRRQLFVGSMNFDRRSKMLNTEVGVIIDSAALAQETVTRFDAMVLPQNAYSLTLRSDGVGRSTRLNWHTEEQGKPVDYSREPARGIWQRLMVRALSLLPLGSQQ